MPRAKFANLALWLALLSAGCFLLFTSPYGSTSAQSERVNYFWPIWPEDEGPARLQFSIELPTDLDPREIQAFVTCNDTQVCFDGSATQIQREDEDGRIIEQHALFSIFLMPGEYLLDISLIAYDRDNDRFNFEVFDFPLTLERPESADLSFLGYEIENINSDGSVDLRFTFEARRVNAIPVDGITIRALCVSEYECKVDKFVTPGWEGETSNAHTVHLSIPGWDLGTNSLTVALTTQYTDRIYGLVTQDFGPFEFDVSIEPDEPQSSNEIPSERVTHSLTIWPEDGGPAEVHFSIELPIDLDALEIQAFVTCNDTQVCFDGPAVQSRRSDEDERIIKRSASFSIFLMPGEYLLDISLIAYNRDNDRINFEVSDFPVTLECPESADLSFLGYEIENINSDGSVDLRFIFEARRVNAIPVDGMTIRALCVSESEYEYECKGYKSVKPGWEGETSNAHTIHLSIPGWDLGTNSLTVTLTTDYGDPIYGVVTQDFGPFVFNVSTEPNEPQPSNAERVTPFQPWWPEDGGPALVHFSIELPTDLDVREIQTFVTCNDTQVCFDGSATPSQNVDKNDRIIRRYATFFIFLMPGEYLLDISLIAYGRGNDRFDLEVSDFLITLERPESADLSFLGYEIENINSDGSVDLRLTFELRRVNAIPVDRMIIHDLCMSEYEACKGSKSVEPGWEGETSNAHTVHLSIPGWDLGTNSLTVSLTTDYADQIYGAVTQNFGPFEFNISTEPNERLEFNAYTEPNEPQSSNETGSVDGLMAPEAKITRHLIDDYKADGTIDATIYFLVHRVGTVPLRSFTIRARCTDKTECGGSIDVFPGWEGNESTPHIVHLPVSGLNAGTQELTFTLSANYIVQEGSYASREVGSYTVKTPTESEYAPVLEQRQTPLLTFDGYHVDKLNLDGTMDVEVFFTVGRSNAIPVRDFTIHAQCVTSPACGGEHFERWAWRDESATPISAVVLIEGLTSGEHTLDAAISASYILPMGGKITRNIEPFIINVPTVEEPVVEFLGHEIISYNQDGTANTELGFRYFHPNALPITAIATSIKRLERKYDSTFVSKSIINPDTDDDAVKSGFDYKVTVNNINPGWVDVSTSITLYDDDPESPPRDIAVEDQTVYIPEQPPVKVRWNVETLDVDGYFMNGSALADITLSAKQIGHQDVVQEKITEVCFVSDTDEPDDCVASDQLLAIGVDSEETSISIEELTVPPGTNTLRLNAGTASGTVEVNTPERIVGIERSVWECFNETEVANGETCSGFTEPIVYKWNLDRVNVYREGDDEYIAIFDESLKVIETITGIDYVIVDNREDARIEAYLGHQGSAEVVKLFGTECGLVAPGCAYDISDDSPYTIDRGYVAVAKRNPEWRDHSISLEDEIRYTTMHELLHVTIPVEHDRRIFNPVVAPPPTYMRQEDMQMYSMIYSPLVEPGMSFADIAQFIVFADETIDYDPPPPSPYDVLEQAYNAITEADSIRLRLTGGNLRGNAYYSGPEIQVHYAAYRDKASTQVRFVSQSWDSIIFGFDQETWSSAGGRWTESSGHDGRGRKYRDHLKFDFILADPLLAVSSAMQANGDIKMLERANGNVTISVTEIGDAFPRSNIERDSGQIIEYSIEWHFGPNRYKDLPYRVEAEVIDYGAEFEIPDEVREKSRYLATP